MTIALNKNAFAFRLTISDKKSPPIVGFRRNATCSKRELFNVKLIHDFVLTFSTKFCNISHRLADI